MIGPIMGSDVGVPLLPGLDVSSKYSTYAAELCCRIKWSFSGQSRALTAELGANFGGSYPGLVHRAASLENCRLLHFLPTFRLKREKFRKISPD